MYVKSSACVTPVHVALLANMFLFSVKPWDDIDTHSALVPFRRYSIVRRIVRTVVGNEML